MSEKTFREDKRDILRLIFSIILLLLAVFFLWNGINFLILNINDGKTILPNEYTSLQTGEYVNGSITKIVGKISVDYNNLYLVEAPNEKIIIFSANYNSDCDKAMEELYSKKEGTVKFKGCVNNLSSSYESAINMNIIGKGYTNGYIRQVINITLYNGQSESENQRNAMGYFILAEICIFIIILLLKKFFIDIKYALDTKKGKNVYIPNVQAPQKLEAQELFKGGVNKNGDFYASETDKNKKLYQPIINKKNNELYSELLKSEKIDADDNDDDDDDD